MSIVNMSMRSLRPSLKPLLLTLLFSIGAALPASAQEQPFSFGPPLRPNIIFAYRYVERVRATHRMEGQVVDSTDRTLTYFITERQLPGQNGTWIVEANIDSMRVDSRGTGGRVLFNTQSMKGSEMLVKHREVLAPSSLVNRMVTFTLSPYGEIIKVDSPALRDLLDQAAVPEVDSFTRDRVTALVRDEHLAAVYLPWRGVAPLGQKVEFDRSQSIPFPTTLDELAFRDTASVKIVRGREGEPGPHLQFTASLGEPISPKLTVTAFPGPVTISSLKGGTTGDLKLDQDGVILSGWVTTTATATGRLGDQKLSSDFIQEVFIDQLGMVPF
jgi:hypothetical protein